MKLRLGTRGSDLALTQSRTVAAALAANGVEAELVVISTSGDRSTAPSFGGIGAQGVFVREIEEALLRREIDCAVHSFKDLPSASPPGLVVAAVPERRDPADWLLCRAEAAADGDGGLLPLRPGARIGTSSARRQAWLRHARPDLALGPLRGNVPTRIRKLAEGTLDAIVLAGAGIERLNEAGDLLGPALAGLVRRRLDPLRFVPAPAQGALAVQCRDADTGAREAIAALDEPGTHRAVRLERAALALAEGGCNTAFGAHARASGERLELIVMTESDGRLLASRVAGDDAELAERALAALQPLDGGLA